MFYVLLDVTRILLVLEIIGEGFKKPSPI